MTRILMEDTDDLQLISIHYQNTFTLQVDDEKPRSCVISVFNNYKDYEVISFDEKNLYIELYLSPDEIMALNLLRGIEVSRWVKQSGILPVYKKYKITVESDE